ncbi:IclR family transcriptional regulator [Rathayibacter soli]|uniref:IclR family transcriptional regulator n=1 Tax=Rathayibacter soli TaxID=3144168 RepID=UPI0027E41BBC|nr:IclR family transcriptional regulator [Glaciibacter superstes]
MAEVLDHVTKQPAGAGARSVEQAFTLLELIADAGGEASLSELAASSGLGPPIVDRLLRTLVDRGYMRHTAFRRYALGPRLARFGEAANKQVWASAEPQLTKLASMLHETASLAVLDGDLVLYVAQAPTQHALRMAITIGKHVPAHASGVGKAILAQLDDVTVRSLVGREGMHAFTTFSLANVSALLAELAVIRRRGYAVDDQEQEIGMRCYAVAIPNESLRAAVSVSGPALRVNDDFGAVAVPLLNAVAVDIADGFNVPLRSY